MSRDLDPALAAEVAAGRMRPVFLYEGEFSTGTVRLWTGLGTLTWDAHDWAGVGSMLGVSPMTETADSRAVGVTVSLNGNVGSLIASVENEARQGKPGKVWLACLDTAGAVIGDPYLCFQGRLDVPEWTDGGANCTISVSYESRLIDLERAPNRRFTDEDQQIDYPGDRGFEFVPSLQDAAIVWGGA